MIKIIKLMLLAGFVLSILAAVGCKEKAKTMDNVMKTDNNKLEKIDTNKIKKDVEIEYWSWTSIEGIVNKFESENSDIKIKTKLIDYFKCKEEYMKALSSGEGPDVLMFYSEMFGDYTVNGSLQDLLEEPFNAEKYHKDFPRWDGGLSIDNKHLFSLSYGIAPQITLYRVDVMKDNGFPTEPEEMGKFLENPDNILAMATKLKKQDKYIFQWPYDLPNIIRMSMGIYDKDLNLTRYGEILGKVLDITKQAHKNNMIVNGNPYTEEGKKAIKAGELVMLLDANSYVPAELEKLAPEQKGLWRLTAPPLGMIAWQFDSRVAINAQSKHKEQAWKFMEYLVTHKSDIFDDKYSIPEYLPARQRLHKDDQRDTFLGGQNIQSFFYKLGNMMVPYKLTPMDEKTNSIFGQGIWKSAEEDTDSGEDIKKIVEEVNKQLSGEKKALMAQ